MFMLPFMFIFPCSLAFMFIGLELALGVADIFALPVVFELSAVLQAVPKAAKANKTKTEVVRRMNFLHMQKEIQLSGGQKLSSARIRRVISRSLPLLPRANQYLLAQSS